MEKTKLYNLIGSLYGGGAERFVANLSCFLPDSTRNTIITYNKKDSTYPYCGNLVDWNELKSSSRILSMFWIFLKLKAYKKRNQHSVFISHMMIPNLLNCTSISKTFQVIVVHGRWSITSEKGRLVDKMINFLYNRADIIVCVSEFMKQQLNEIHDIRVPTKVIYNGIDLEKVRLFANESSTLKHLPHTYIVYVAGFRPVKNHLMLLDNLKGFLLTTNYHLILIGDGELMPTIKNKINNLGLQSKVIIAGHLENPFPVVKNARYALIASKTESFSLVAIEAMCLGIPVISTDCGGPREILAPEHIDTPLPHTPYRGEGGVLISNKLTDSIGSIISSIDNNSSIYQKLKDQAKKRSEDFHIRKSALLYQQLIDKLIREN